MKILVVASNLNVLGGIQVYNKKSIKAFKDLGAKVLVSELVGVSFLNKTIFILGFFVRVFFLRPDIVFITHLNYSPLGYWAKKLFGMKYTITVYGIEVQAIKEKYIKTIINAEYVVHLFEAAKRDVIRQVPGMKNKALQLPNSIDGSRFYIKDNSEELIGKWNLKDSKIISTLCRMSREDGDNKGYRRVIQAMPEILEKIPNAKYVLAGGGDDLDGAKELARSLSLADKVIFPGPLKEEDKVDFYNMSDVFVLPSKNEGFPSIVLLEALACGTLCVGGDQPGAEVALGNGKLGLIAEADSVADIAKKIIDCLMGSVNHDLLNKELVRKYTIEMYGDEAYMEYAKRLLNACRR